MLSNGHKIADGPLDEVLKMDNDEVRDFFTRKEPDVLSRDAPKTVEQIEALMAR